MATKKRAAKPIPPQGDLTSRLFEKELAGEQGPPVDLAAELCAQSEALFARQPWTVVSDSDLILFEDRGSGEMCYCSVMGALGQVYSLHAFIGSAGYQVYQAIATQEPGIAESIYSLSRSVFVEWVARVELTPPDKELLRKVGVSSKPGGRVPMFRALRPGYQPWFPTEAEARMLLGCLGAAGAVLDHLNTEAGSLLWDQAHHYPQAIPGGNGKYKIARTKLPQRSRAVLELPNIDEKRVAAILKSGWPVKGVLELDCFHSRATIGKKHERKACLGMAMAIDAKTAFAFPPQLTEPGQPIAELLPDVLMTAIETSHSIPLEVHVRDRDQKHQLDRLARELGFKLKATESLPAFDFAKEHLTELLGG